MRQSKPFKPRAVMARLVPDVRDARLDKFIPLSEARERFAKGELASIDIGPAYPNSFEEIRK